MHDLELLDHAGNMRSLYSLVAGAPCVMHFSPGSGSQQEWTYLRQHVTIRFELGVVSARIVSGSIDPPRVSAAFRALLGARWTFLFDPDRVWFHELPLLEKPDPVYRPYLPT